MNRRSFVRLSAAGFGATALSNRHPMQFTGAQWPPPPPDVDLGERPFQDPSVRVVNPADRVPLSFIIDDSTCLVNLAHYGIPQFQEVFPDRYRQAWRLLPREIPDTFVRTFGEWCRSKGVKGKYSIVPYPACVGWIDRFLPGWSRSELEASLDLVREFMVQDWDIHPEMISHTRVIDIKTGRPYPEPTPAFMENWDWSQDKSADELAAYIAYALRILKRVGLPCEGHTTPGGFGSRNQNNLALGTLEAVRDVYSAEVPHYFRNLYTDPDADVQPKVYHASGLKGADPRCVVSIVGCTGDWFGGWDGLVPGNPDRFITEDLTAGRLVEVIESGQPAVLVCHWPGIYYNGQQIGFKVFQAVVDRLERRFPRTRWMKNSEIARYWAAKVLTEIRRTGNTIDLHAPFAAPRFTIALSGVQVSSIGIADGAGSRRPEHVDSIDLLDSNRWTRHEDRLLICLDLVRGVTRIQLDV